MYTILKQRMGCSLAKLCTLFVRSCFVLYSCMIQNLKKKATRVLFRSISRKAVGASDCLREKASHREAAHQKVCYLFRKYRPNRTLGELILLAGRLNYIAERKCVQGKSLRIGIVYIGIKGQFPKCKRVFDNRNNSRR